MEQYYVQPALCVSQQQYAVQRQQQQGLPVCQGDRDDACSAYRWAERVSLRGCSESRYEAHLRLPVLLCDEKGNEQGEVTGLVRRESERSVDFFIGRYI